MIFALCLASGPAFAQSAGCGGWLRVNLSLPCPPPPDPPPPPEDDLRQRAEARRAERLACDPAAAGRAFPETAVLRHPERVGFSEDLAKAAAAARMAGDETFLLTAAEDAPPAQAFAARILALMILAQRGESLESPPAKALFTRLERDQADAATAADLHYLRAVRALRRGEPAGAALAAEAALREPGEAGFYQAHLIRATARLRLARRASDGPACLRAFGFLIAAVDDLAAASPCASHLGRLHAFWTADARAPERDAPLAFAESYLAAVLSHEAGWRGALARLGRAAARSSCAAAAYERAASLAPLFEEAEP